MWTRKFAGTLKGSHRKWQLAPWSSIKWGALKTRPKRGSQKSPWVPSLEHTDKLACFSVLLSVFENKRNKQETDKSRLHLLVSAQTVTMC